MGREEAPTLIQLVCKLWIGLALAMLAGLSIFKLLMFLLTT